jgi:hypothetical protein
MLRYDVIKGLKVEILFYYVMVDWVLHEEYQMIWGTLAIIRTYHDLR